MPEGVEVYLFPTVVGGGLGDIEEVLAAGRILSSAGYPVLLYRARGRPLPPSVDGPWDWPRLRRRSALKPQSERAITIAPSWGVSAAPDQPGAFGRGGPWQAEAAAIEAAYGSSATVHVSLEEFGRTWSGHREAAERWREGGTASRAVRAIARGPRFRAEAAEWRVAYRRFRAFDRPNVLHLYAAFRPRPGFSREFPEAVQSGPLWPHRDWTRYRRAAEARRSWVWYASPASSEWLLPAILEGLSAQRTSPFLWIRSPRPWASPPKPPLGRLDARAWAPARWSQRFARADLRIVTGSRTLLEAIELGGPFLYFNGVLGEGRRRRRHRPDKIEALLEAARERRLDEGLVRDLQDFSRARRVAEVVERAVGRVGAWADFPRGPWVAGFRPPYDEAGNLLRGVARALAQGEEAPELVRRARAGALR